MVAGDALPRAQLDDHIPAVLIAFEERLRHRPNSNEPCADSADQAAAHGLHRWQQGYDLREVVRELGLLNEIMVTVLDTYARDNAQVATDIMMTARGEWATGFTDNVEESAAQYFQLQRIEAEGHVRDLEAALRDLGELEKHRADLWRQLAHDLRGNVGVVASVASGLGVKNAPDAVRDRFVHMLDRNIGSLRNLLDDATELARLQAGRERRQLSAFDVAPILVELCEGFQAFAEERGLYLRVEGPPALPIESDPAKLRRIAQNLILNALKFTRSGGVHVRWESGDETDRKRWILTVRDTGPGLGSGAPIKDALKQATDLSESVDDDDPGSDTSASQPPASVGVDHSPGAPDVAEARRRGAGEGLGLSIVKRLSELLDATVEVDSDPGKGATFRVRFPLEY